MLDRTDHRPWPMPGSPWIMTQTWHDVLFAHWPVDRALLEARLPRSCTLDLFDRQAWLGIVAFEMSNVGPRFVPVLPWLSTFPEINVRTYVRVDDKPGVYFFSLDATNPVAVWVARRLFHLPYHTAAIDVRREAHTVAYRCRRRNADAGFESMYWPAGAAAEAGAGSLEYFLTERYCLYTVDAANRLMRCDIHHPPWPLQPANATIGSNTLADAAGISLPPISPVVHFSKRQDTVNWPLTPVHPRSVTAFTTS